MLHITRVDFPADIWGQHELDDLARLRLARHDQAGLLALPALPSYHRVRMRLWGVAKPDLEAIQAKLQQRVEDAGFSEHVCQDDEGLLTVATSWQTAAQPCPLGAWAAIVNDRAFD